MIIIPHNLVKPNGKVDLWDMGPQVSPKAPNAPEMPDRTKLKGAELAAAELEYEDAFERYKDELRAYTAQRKAHSDWNRDKGGPVKVELWGADARHALAVEPDRYVIELPRGMRPGKAQIEAEELAKIEADELRQARSRDPLHSGAMQ